MARPVSLLRLLYGMTAGRTRALAFGAAAASCAAKIAIVVTALVVAKGLAMPAVASAVVVGALVAVQRVLQNAARVGAECDLYRTACARLLATDVLEAPVASPQRTIFESGWYARAIVTDSAPELVTNVVAALAIAPILVHELPARALGLAGAALAVVLIGVAIVRRWTAAWSERVAGAQEIVARRAILAAEGRLEIVASGSDEAFATSLDAAIDAYRTTASRGAWASALVGRAPLAAGAALVAAVVILDGGSDAVVTSALLANALVLASALPVVVGLVVGANELVRSLARVDDVAALLRAPARPELARRGAAVPSALAPLDVAAARFAYDAGGADVLHDVTFSWRGDEPLVLEGANGSGKSTLLRLLLGLRSVGSGRVAIGGEDVASLDLSALRRAIAYLPQDAYLGEPGASVRDAVLMLEPTADDAAITTALAKVDLLAALRAHGGEPLDVGVSELSTGQRQRLALARALVRDARMYLLDEPDANVDREGVDRVAGIVRELAKSGKKVVVAAHTPELADVARERVRLR